HSARPARLWGRYTPRAICLSVISGPTSGHRNSHPYTSDRCIVASPLGWPDAPGSRPPSTHRQASPSCRWTLPLRPCYLPATELSARESWGDDSRSVGDRASGPAHRVIPRHGCLHADQSHRIVAFLSPQSGSAVGCSSPMQPHCSARLRSLLDDYQTAFSTDGARPPCRPPRTTGSHLPAVFPSARGTLLISHCVSAASGKTVCSSRQCSPC